MDQIRATKGALHHARMLLQQLVLLDMPSSVSDKARDVMFSLQALLDELTGETD